MPIILAIDPGYDRCGIAIIEGGTKSAVLYSACIETSKKDTHEQRLADVYSTLESVVAKWHPDTLALETLFFSVNKKTALKVAEARGVVLLLAGTHRLPLVELSPQAVKLSMTGIGNATKEQVQKMVGLVLKQDISKKLDDEVDAIAIGLAALQHYRVDNLAKGLAKGK